MGPPTMERHAASFFGGERPRGKMISIPKVANEIPTAGTARGAVRAGLRRKAAAKFAMWNVDSFRPLDADGDIPAGCQLASVDVGIKKKPAVRGGFVKLEIFRRLGACG